MKEAKITAVQWTKNQPPFFIEDTLYERQKQKVAAAAEVIDRLKKDEVGTMEKVKLTKGLADLLEAQLNEVSIHIHSKDHEDISHFLITTMFSYETRPKSYNKFFSGAYTDLLSSLGDMKYIDTLRVGYEVEATLEEEYIEAWELEIHRLKALLREEGHSLDPADCHYNQGRLDESRGSLASFKNYLKRKEAQGISE